MGKVKEFWTENKELIIGVAGIAVGAGTIGWVIGATKNSVYIPSNLVKFLANPESGIVGELCQVGAMSKLSSWWRRDMSDVKYTIADLGKAGEDLISITEGRFKPDDVINGILLYTD